ncbi:MAG: hypothetical protein LBJ41_05705 [Treponema sp.]|jgi:hypothetical protein|nr:hypothetical protein [Treponema sp.]
MFIKYKPKNAHIKTIPIVMASSGGNAVPLANDSVILRPGTNELTERQWKAIQPHVQDEIKDKIIVPFSVEVKKDGDVTKARTLKDVPVSVARKIIESCQNVVDLKKWARQELPDEIMLLVLKRLRKFKIDPDEFGDDISSEEDTLDADITPEKGNEIPEDGKPDETDGKDGLHEDSGGGGRRGKKGATGKKKSRVSDPEPKGNGDENDSEDNEDEVPDFDGSGGKE